MLVLRSICFPEAQRSMLRRKKPLNTARFIFVELSFPSGNTLDHPTTSLKKIDCCPSHLPMQICQPIRKKVVSQTCLCKCSLKLRSSKRRRIRTDSESELSRSVHTTKNTPVSLPQRLILSVPWWNTLSISIRRTAFFAVWRAHCGIFPWLSAMNRFWLVGFRVGASPLWIALQSGTSVVDRMNYNYNFGVNTCISKYMRIYILFPATTLRQIRKNPGQLSMTYHT